MKVRADENLKNAQKQLQQVQSEAEEMFGTSNIAELMAMLEKMELENKQLQADYQKHLDEVESELQAVDKEYSQSEDEQ